MNIIFLEAVEALQKFHNNNSSVFDEFGRYLGERVWVQPSELDSTIGRKFVYLNNVNGSIAKYNYHTGEITI